MQAEAQPLFKARAFRIEGLMQPVPPDRRSRVRFPMDLPFCYRTLDRNIRSGAGRVLNVSSRGVLAACAHQLTAGTTVELTMEWPAQLDGRVPLHLVMLGTIVRCEVAGFAVAAFQYRFQPARLASTVDDVSDLTGALPSERQQEKQAPLIDLFDGNGNTVDGGVDGRMRESNDLHFVNVSLPAQQRFSSRP